METAPVPVAESPATLTSVLPDPLPGACSLCGGGRLDEAFSIRGGEFRVFACGGCGAGILWPRPAATALEGLYAEDYHRRGKGRLSRPAEAVDRPFKRALGRRILRRVRGGRILDIGYGRGTLLRFLAARGFDAWGLEIAPEVPEELRGAAGLTLLKGVLEDLGLPDAHFDAVTLIHVLEHLADPFSAFREARRILKPGGFLFVAVPNRDSLQARFAGRSWFHLDPPYHLFHFTRAAILALARKAGFAVDAALPGGLDHHLFGWVQSLLNLLGLRQNALFDLLRSPAVKTAPPPWRRLGPALLHAALAPGLLALAVPLVCVERIAGRPGTLFFVLRKPLP